MTPFNMFLIYPPEDDEIWVPVATEFYRKWVQDAIYYSRHLESNLLPENPCVNPNVIDELFPFLTITIPYADPTNVTNDDGPLFGADPFVAFALSIAPITHMGVAGVIISTT
jgi:hypothetical protein